MNNEHIASNFFLVLLIVAAVTVGLIFLPYINALILAIVFAIIFYPEYKRLHRIMPRHESIAAFISVLFAFVIILIPLIFLGIIMFGEAQGVYANLAINNGSYVSSMLHEQIAKILPTVNIDFSQYAKGFLDWLIANIGPIFSQLAGITLTFFLAAFTLFYFLRDGHRIRALIVKASPLKHDDTEKILDKLMKMAGSVIKGSLVMSVLQGAIVGIGFYIFGLQNPVLWGSAAIICALVPIIGVAIVVLPAAIIVWLSGHMAIAIGFAVWGLLLPAITDNVLRPRLIDRETNTNRLLILFSVIGGIAAFGPLGFILGPLALSLLLTLIEIYPSIFKEGSKA